MAIIQYGIAAGKAGNSLLDTLRGYFVRYRLTLYLLSAAAVVLGVVLNWNWLTAAGLFRVVAVLPCALMMFSCIRPGTRRSDHETALHHGALPSSSDPQRSLSPRLDRNTSSGSPVNDLWHLLRKSRLIPNSPKRDEP
jgi:hypothetical protein